jgi:hypothetical protein
MLRQGKMVGGGATARGRRRVRRKARELREHRDAAWLLMSVLVALGASLILIAHVGP